MRKVSSQLVNRKNLRQKSEIFMGFSLNASELQEYQPNRYPFLMIDRVTDVEPGEFAKGYKLLTNNEWYFPVHTGD